LLWIHTFNRLWFATENHCFQKHLKCIILIKGDCSLKKKKRGQRSCVVCDYSRDSPRVIQSAKRHDLQFGIFTWLPWRPPMSAWRLKSLIRLN
jgi:hypothetical protein